MTPVATFEGNYVAKRITDATGDPIKYPIIPTIVYASPKLAEVGVTKVTPLRPDQSGRDGSYQLVHLSSRQ